MFFLFFASLRTIFFKLSLLVSSLVRDFSTSSSWLDFTLWNIRKPILLLLNKTNMMFMRVGIFQVAEYQRLLIVYVWSDSQYSCQSRNLFDLVLIDWVIFFLSCWFFSTGVGGGGAPYKGYIGMCGPKECSFSAVLVINGVSNFCHFVINKACFSNEAAFSSLRLIRPSIKAFPKLCLRRFNIGLN